MSMHSSRQQMPIPMVRVRVQPRVSHLSIGAMVASIVGVGTGIFILGFVGVILGHIARVQIRRSGLRGDGMALVGLWLGYLGSLLWGAFIVAWFAAPEGMLGVFTFLMGSYLGGV